jgi:hypothetical protein
LANVRVEEIGIRNQPDIFIGSEAIDIGWRLHFIDYKLSGFHQPVQRFQISLTAEHHHVLTGRFCCFLSKSRLRNKPRFCP